MLAIAGPQLSRRDELLALIVTVLASAAIVVVPVLYVVLLPAVCAIAALTAPIGRRVPMAMAVWVPLSLAVLVGTA